MTKLNRNIAHVNNQDPKAYFECHSSCWNYYGTNFSDLVENKNSNLHKTIKSLKKGKYLIMTGAIGWSRNSRTSLHIFRLSRNWNNSYGYELEVS